MKKNILRIFLIILILLWMRLVFGFSSDNAERSSTLSLRISKIFTSNEEKLEIVEPIVRKLAHLSEYFVRPVFYFLVYF